MSGNEDEEDTRRQEVVDRGRRRYEIGKGGGSTLKKVFKSVAILIILIITSCLLIISKGTTIFLVGQLNPGSTNEFVLGEGKDPSTCSKYGTRFRSEVPPIVWKLSLYGILVLPEVLTAVMAFFRSLKEFDYIWEELKVQTKCIYRGTELAVQTVHLVGLFLLFFFAFPGMSATTVILAFNATLILPALLRMISKKEGPIMQIWIYRVLDFLALGVQLSSVLLFYILEANDKTRAWALPTGLTLVSFAWWKTFESNEIDKINLFQESRAEKNYVSKFIVSVWKVLVISVGIFIVLGVEGDLGYENLPLQHNSSSDIFRFGYNTSKVSTIELGSMPILKYITSPLDCNKAKASFYVTYESMNDCSCFWMKECTYLTKDNSTQTLYYVQCPGRSKYIGGPNSKCWTENTCCDDTVETADCGDRIDYQCSHTENELVIFKYPDSRFKDESEEGSHWFIEALYHYKTVYPLLIMIVQGVSTFLAFKGAAYICRCQILFKNIDLGFGILVLSSLVLTTAAIMTLCAWTKEDPLYFHNVVPVGLYFHCNSNYPAQLANLKIEFFFFLTIAAQLWIGRHIWRNSAARLALTETIFFSMFYNPLLIDQSLIFERRPKKKKATDEPLQKIKACAIKACATMWHETKKEMSKLLESVKNVDIYLNSLPENVKPEDKFEWEQHIFFDDAFEATTGNVNKFVKDFMSSMKETFGEYNKDLSMTKVLTPYGGQLIWSLGQKTKIITHLKDKRKIKNKKRWSQCMYIAFFMRKDLVEKNCGWMIKNARKTNEVDDIYILALDGDVSFTPSAVLKILDTARKDPKIGSVCGQIHPVGKGIIYLYQKFEYYIGHWLQKSTESVLGNVLCSPGCFSLMRGNALVKEEGEYDDESDKKNIENDNKHVLKKKNYEKELDKSVLQKYLTVSEEPRHFIQYDQGEDRWLCTLLIERGFKIEYSALSHCKTACPESFDEFYNQRRRWSPSTVANLWDLLYNGGWTMVKKGFLSPLHIFYQFATLSAAAIGPGSIFLMMVGGLGISLGISNWVSLVINALPIFGFLCVSILSKRKYQIMVAKGLSLMYGLFMISILIAMAIEYKKTFYMCHLTPPILSLVITTGSFLTVAFLHLYISSSPFHLIVPVNLFKFMWSCFIFFLLIPSMYMVLPFYCVFNMDDVSWGTRETKVDQDILNSQERIKRKQSFIHRVFSQPASSPTVGRLDNILEGVPTSPYVPPANWIDVDYAMHDNVGDLKEEEKKFWDYVIGSEAQGSGENAPKYKEYLAGCLKPIVETDSQKEEVVTGLKALRTEIFLVFFFTNATWFFAIFMMQQAFEESGLFGFDWPPCPISDQLTISLLPLNTTAPSYEEPLNYYQLDPINLIFLLFFLGILATQVLGMLMHRAKTLAHFVSTINLWEKYYTIEARHAEPEERTETREHEYDTVYEAGKDDERYDPEPGNEYWEDGGQVYSNIGYDVESSV